MHQISTVQRNLDSGFFISENTQYPAIGPVRACDVINIAGSFLLKIELSKSKGEVFLFQAAPRLMLAGALFSFSPPLHTSPPRLFTGWEEDINAARFQRLSEGEEPKAKRDSSFVPAGGSCSTPRAKGGTKCQSSSKIGITKDFTSNAL